MATKPNSIAVRRTDRGESVSAISFPTWGDRRPPACTLLPGRPCPGRISRVGGEYRRQGLRISYIRPAKHRLLKQNRPDRPPLRASTPQHRDLAMARRRGPQAPARIEPGRLDRQNRNAAGEDADCPAAGVAGRSNQTQSRRAAGRCNAITMDRTKCGVAVQSEIFHLIIKIACNDFNDIEFTKY